MCKYVIKTCKISTQNLTKLKTDSKFTWNLSRYLHNIEIQLAKKTLNYNSSAITNKCSWIYYKIQIYFETCF